MSTQLHCKKVFENVDKILIKNLKNLNGSLYDHTESDKGEIKEGNSP